MEGQERPTTRQNGGGWRWAQTVTPERGKQIWLTMAPTGARRRCSGTFERPQRPSGILDQAGKVRFGAGGVAPRGTSESSWLQWQLKM